MMVLKKTVLLGALILISVTAASPARAQTAPLSGDEYTPPTPPVKNAVPPAPAQPVIQPVARPAGTVAAGSAPSTAAPTAPRQPTAADYGIVAPASQAAPGSNAAILQEHQMEQLRAILAPTPARPKDIIQDKTKIITDDYKETTFENLAHMYWAIGKFQDDDDVAVDNYLLVTECKLYKKYHGNEFQWQDIRKATREFLRKNISKMPTRFEVLQEIELDNYDVNSGEFILKPDSVASGISRIEIETNDIMQPVCDQKEDVDEYPRNIIVNLSTPFTLKSFPVDPRIAELYIQETRLNYMNATGQQRVDGYKRKAYVRLKLKMMQFKEDVPYGHGVDRKLAVIFAALEGWDVFADEAETKPLYSYMLPKGFLPKAMGYGSNRPKDDTQYTAPSELQ